ncbi:MAG: pyruvoyl-dependent arginine decarboxylase [Acidimicrobiales bacterium]
MTEIQHFPSLLPSLTPSLHISVTSGVATGSTKLAAFDAALRQASVGNFNLIRLSSVVPAGAVVSQKPPLQADPHGSWGDRLYVVLAECRVDAVHQEAWAGIGWVQDNTTGRGLLVEHEGHSRAQVEADINSSLDDLVAGRPGLIVGEKHWLIDGGTCVDDPLCALVVAAFEGDPWRGDDVIDLT